MTYIALRNRSLIGDVCENLTDHDRGEGMRLVFVDGLTSQAMETLASGLFLTAFAVALGASNSVIGFLAAIPSLAQLMQIPGVVIVERVRQRRLVTVLAAAASRASLVLMGLGIILPTAWVLPLLIFVAMAHAFFGSIAGCSWNSWMRDLLPADKVSSFFARRMMYSTLLGAVLSLIVAHYLATAQAIWPQQTIVIFSMIAMIGGLVGLVGVGLVWRTPEPKMARRDHTQSMKALMVEPFLSPNYRRMMVFLATWGICANLATPFFTVYMLGTLHLELSTVTMLVICSQLANVVAVRGWGLVADRFSNKTVLRIAGSLFVTCLLGWIFTGNPGPHAATLPMLAVLHVAMGVATAGVTLASASIVLKLSPTGKATAYVAANSVISSLAGGVAPIVGGLLADVFATRQLGITIHWTSPGMEFVMPALQMRHWQFFFAFACIVGLHALYRLKRVRESGDVRNKVVARRILNAARRVIASRSLSRSLRPSTAALSTGPRSAELAAVS